MCFDRYCVVIHCAVWQWMPFGNGLGRGGKFPQILRTNISNFATGHSPWKWNHGWIVWLPCTFTRSSDKLKKVHFDLKCVAYLYLTNQYNLLLYSSRCPISSIRGILYHADIIYFRRTLVTASIIMWLSCMQMSYSLNVEVFLLDLPISYSTLLPLVHHFTHRCT